MTPLDLFLRACFSGFSLVLLAVSLSAYKRFRETRLAVVTGAFLLFFIISLLVLLSGFTGLDEFDISSFLVAMNLGILLCLYFAIVKR